MNCVAKLTDIVGTPIFMAPQLQNNIAYTAKSDVWSIGMMFYYMLFGTFAWSCRDIKALIMNTKNNPLRFPYSV